MLKDDLIIELRNKLAFYYDCCDHDFYETINDYRVEEALKEFLENRYSEKSEKELLEVKMMDCLKYDNFDNYKILNDIYREKFQKNSVSY